MKKRVFLFAAIIVCFIIFLFYISQHDSGNVQLGVIDSVEISDDTLQKMTNDIVSDSAFQIFINTDITLNSNNEADFLVQNTVRNSYDCYIELLNENGASIYKSSVIQPGYKLEHDIIASGLHDGKNNCLVYFHVLDDSGYEINQIGVNVNVTKI